MWSRANLLLILVRLYFALSPSYIHPDENFQGPEVIAGRIFSFPHSATWEFTSSDPIRSVFPLWLFYGLPMTVLRWVCTETGKEEVAPKIIYYTLRVLMFILSLVLEDWAIRELVPSRRQRRVAVVLVASSYVTWTYQTHTFSNSIETLLVTWSLVYIQRILEKSQKSSLLASAILGFLITFGTFNRITFPAFLLAPGLYLVPHFFRKPLSLLIFTITAVLTALLAITIDTSFYQSLTLSNLLQHPTLTPLNSLLYNTSPSNLALHGTHPPYQHFFVNFPILLGPALLTLPFLPSPFPPPLPLTSALTGTLLLSFISHQETRFLLPAVPLLLSSLRLPISPLYTRYFLLIWLIFNAALGVLMGIYHQGGVIPTQLWLGQQNGLGLAEVLWWRTYSPPVWLLDGKGILTTDLMGMRIEKMMGMVAERVEMCDQRIGLVAPRSSVDLDAWMNGNGLIFDELWAHTQHVNLDDLDIGGDGIWATLERVIGRRGLVFWSVRKRCDKQEGD